MCLLCPPNNPTHARPCSCVRSGCRTCSVDGLILEWEQEAQQMGTHPDLMGSIFGWGAGRCGGAVAVATLQGLPLLPRSQELRRLPLPLLQLIIPHLTFPPCPTPPRPACSFYSTLYLSLLQYQGDSDKLLQLLLANKKR